MADEDDRKAILGRRNRLIAIAITGLTSAAPGCYDAHRTGDDAAVSSDAGPPVPCLSRPIEDAGPPMPCLGMPIEDAGPMPCLEPPPEDAGPTPCLDVAIDAGTDE